MCYVLRILFRETLRLSLPNCAIFLAFSWLQESVRSCCVCEFHVLFTGPLLHRLYDCDDDGWANPIIHCLLTRVKLTLLISG